MHAFILAGGFATRLWPLTEQRAKPLLPLAGKPILTHLVEDIPDDVPVTVSTNAAFSAAFDDWRQTLGRPVELLIEETASDREKLGALGATAQWIRTANINDDILLLTGDNYCGFRFADFLAAVQPGTPLIAAHDIGDLALASAFGTIVLHEDATTVVAFEEKPREPRSTLVSTGCSVIPSDALPILLSHAERHPDNVGGLFEALLAAGRTIHCFRFTEPWFDIGSFDAYLDATRALVGANVLTGQDAAIEDTVTDGSIVLGDGSRVRASQLRDVVLFRQCDIEDCVLDRCVLDDGCVLRGVDLTGKMLRAGTTLIKRG